MAEILFETGYISGKPWSWNEPRKCVVCGTEYIPKMARQKTCCKTCSNAYNAEVKRIKGREYWAAHKEKINAERGKTGETRLPKEAWHKANKESAKIQAQSRATRKKNMAEIAKIALISNGDYGEVGVY